MLILCTWLQLSGLEPLILEVSGAESQAPRQEFGFSTKRPLSWHRRGTFRMGVSFIQNFAQIPLRQVAETAALYCTLHRAIMSDFNPEGKAWARYNAVQKKAWLAREGMTPSSNSNPTLAATANDEMAKEHYGLYFLTLGRYTDLCNTLIERVRTTLLLFRTGVNIHDKSRPIDYLSGLFEFQYRNLQRLPEDTISLSDQYKENFAGNFTLNAGWPKYLQAKHFRESLKPTPETYTRIMAGVEPDFTNPTEIHPCVAHPEMAGCVAETETTPESGNGRKKRDNSTPTIRGREVIAHPPFIHFQPDRGFMDYDSFRMGNHRVKRFVLALLGIVTAISTVASAAAVSMSAYDTAQIGYITTEQSKEQTILESLVTKVETMEHNTQLVDRKVDTLFDGYLEMSEEIALDKVDQHLQKAENVLHLGYIMISEALGQAEHSYPELRAGHLPYSLITTDTLKYLYDNVSIKATEQNQRLFAVDPAALLTYPTTLSIIQGEPYMMTTVPIHDTTDMSLELLEFEPTPITHDNYTYTVDVEDAPYLVINAARTLFQEISFKEFQECKMSQGKDLAEYYCPRLPQVLRKDTERSCQVRLLRNNHEDVEKFCRLRVNPRQHSIVRLSDTKFELYADTSTLISVYCKDRLDHTFSCTGVCAFDLKPGCKADSPAGMVYASKDYLLTNSLAKIQINLEPEKFLAKHQLDGLLTDKHLEKVMASYAAIPALKGVDFHHIHVMLNESARALTDFQAHYHTYKTEWFFGVSALVFLCMMTFLIIRSCRKRKRSRALRREIAQDEELRPIAGTALAIPRF